jgi:hypothetical protein
VERADDLRALQKPQLFFKPCVNLMLWQKRSGPDSEKPGPLQKRQESAYFFLAAFFVVFFLAVFFAAFFLAAIFFSPV